MKIMKYDFILYIAIVATIVSSVCWIDFGNTIVNAIVVNIPCVVLFIADLFLIKKYKINNVFNTIKKILIDRKTKTLLFLIFIFSIYTLFNVINGIKYGMYSYLLLRLMKILKYIFLLINIIYYINKENNLKCSKSNIIFVIGISNYFIVIWTLAKYFSGNFLEITKITPCHDYNVFAIVLLFTTTVMLHWLANYYNGKLKSLFIVMTIIISGTVIFASASRRGVVLFLLCSFIYFIYGCIYIFHNRKKKLIKSVAILLVICSISVVGINTLFYGFNRYVEWYPQRQIEKLEKKQVEYKNEDIAGFGETRITKRYETINIDEGITSRRDIWEIAINEIKNLNVRELIFGAGAGYQKQIYKFKENMDILNVDDTNVLNPHNIFLSDILEGGIVKAILFIGIVIYILYIIIRRGKENIFESLLLFSLGMIIAGFVLLSSHGSILNEDLFWYYVMLIIPINKVNEKEIA